MSGWAFARWRAMEVKPALNPQNSNTSIQVSQANRTMNCRSRGDLVFSMLILVPSTPPRSPAMGPMIAPARPIDVAALAAELPLAAAVAIVAALAEPANTGRAASTATPADSLTLRG